MAGNFDLYYSDEPFSIMDKNQQTYLDPDLIMLWKNRSVFRPIIKFAKNLGDHRATSMSITQLLEPHANTDVLAARQIWMESMHVDSRQVDITFQHNGNKIAYHKYDDMITYWQLNNVAGMRRVATGALGQAEVDMNDMLARNAILQASFTSGYKMFTNSSTDFGDIGILAADKFDPDLGSDIWLGMTYRDVPGAVNASGNGAGGQIVCFTSPGVIYDIQGDTNWIDVRKYASPGMLLNYEAGTYKNVRYVSNPKLTLWNCGTVSARAPISTPLFAGDGAPNPASVKVDGTYKVGQGSSSITNYVQLGTFDEGTIASIEANDMITLHRTLTNAYGVTDGVNFQEGELTVRRVISVDSDNSRITLDKPILVDYDTDLGGGVFGYITKGRNVHASIFVGGPDALVAGVRQQPMFYYNPPIDDFKAIHRFSFDQYIGYQLYAPEQLEVVFSAGTTRIKGAKAVQ